MVEDLYSYNDNVAFEVDEIDRTVRFVCPEHRMPMVVERYSRMPITLGVEVEVKCPLCEKMGKSFDDRCFQHTEDKLEERALAMYDAADYRDAKLIRIDDIYTPEVSKKINPKDTDYFITIDVKKDKDGDTIIVVYVGHRGGKEKAEFFIKPEKLGLTHDHHDLDPAKVLAKIELILKDRTITQDFSGE